MGVKGFVSASYLSEQVALVVASKLIKNYNSWSELIMTRSFVKIKLIQTLFVQTLVWFGLVDGYEDIVVEC